MQGQSLGLSRLFRNASLEEFFFQVECGKVEETFGEMFEISYLQGLEKRWLSGSEE